MKTKENDLFYGSKPLSFRKVFYNVLKMNKRLSTDPQEIVIREMNDEEFHCYCQFSFENFLAEAAKSSGKTIEELREKHRGAPDSRSENDLWLIISVANREAGFIWIHMRPDQDESFGYDIHLHPEFRSQGIGREAMSRCADFVRKRGISKVRICVFETNSIARSLYQSLGFREINFNTERRQYTLELNI
jgi:ribosomal protein S18 acetylase RimI-like enzyme